MHQMYEIRSKQVKNGKTCQAIKAILLWNLAWIWIDDCTLDG